ncbi:hypothetical protein F4V43_01800 [Paenibacillus spiritus]|uniref:Uncharacterized protein n=1 Tax=Paenibacillus spiritus TaxID=2496557 RepID=A0A5J5GGH5_9BACL|nr:hypothetical protein [Paenibacillus spiritus]KAA9007245.1 hypothetical protein F4V43_01800 [Paenibacillus spiritus]
MDTKEEIIAMLNDRIDRWRELVRVSNESKRVKCEWEARISELETVRDIIKPEPPVEEEY